MIINAVEYESPYVQTSILRAAMPRQAHTGTDVTMTHIE
jgi:hypothetical protein